MSVRTRVGRARSCLQSISPDSPTCKLQQIRVQEPLPVAPGRLCERHYDREDCTMPGKFVLTVS